MRFSSSHLILSPPPNVSADVNDLFANREPREDVVELLHGLVDDVVNSAGDVHVRDQLLVARQSAPGTILSLRVGGISGRGLKIF